VHGARVDQPGAFPFTVLDVESQWFTLEVPSETVPLCPSTLFVRSLGATIANSIH
jgi:hypothetical protein